VVELMLAILLAALESEADKQKFTDIYEQYHPQMEQTALRILKDQHDAEDAVLASWYERNQGDPLSRLIPFLADLVDRLPAGAWIQASATTGYGAQLAQAALGSLLRCA